MASHNRNYLPPGTAVVWKGEPTATEIAKLRISLSATEEGAIEGVLDASLARYAGLIAGGQVALDEHVTRVTEAMADRGLDTPLIEHFPSSTFDLRDGRGC